MHHYSQLETLAAERIRSRLAEAEGSRLTHRARADSRAVRTTRGEARSKKLRLAYCIRHLQQLTPRRAS
jgi:Na+-transporting NADH:ubiquinone oxidoreductase subunit NqrC